MKVFLNVLPMLDPVIIIIIITTILDYSALSYFRYVPESQSYETGDDLRLFREVQIRFGIWILGLKNNPFLQNIWIRTRDFSLSLDCGSERRKYIKLSSICFAGNKSGNIKLFSSTLLFNRRFLFFFCQTHICYAVIMISWEKGQNILVY